MKTSPTKALLTALVLLVFSIGCASTGGGGGDVPAPPPPPAPPAAVGVWDMTIETPMGDQNPTVTIQGTADALTGEFDGPTGALAFDSISADGDALNFQVTIDIGGQDLVLKFVGTVDGDAMNGEFESDFGNFPANAVRSAE